MSRVHPAKFVHVVYRTRRFEQMLALYQTAFDAKVQHQNPALAFLTYDDEHHRFAFANLSVLQPDRAETDKQGLIGIDHVADTYASLNDLFENYVQLRANGILPYWCTHHSVTSSTLTATRWSFRSTPSTPTTKLMPSCAGRKMPRLDWSRYTTPKSSWFDCAPANPFPTSWYASCMNRFRRFGSRCERSY